MDRTNDFHRALRSARTTEKTDDAPSNRRKRGEFAENANDIVRRVSKSSTVEALSSSWQRNRIAQLRSFLLTHENDYANRFGHGENSVFGSTMTDSERDEIDREAQEYVSVCSTLINRLKPDVSAVGEQQKKHRRGVVSVLNRYLKDVCSIYSRQKAVRVKRIIDKRRLTRLKADPLPTTKEHPVPSSTGTDFDTGLTQEERETFQQENAQLLEELTTSVDEVRQLESKVVEIGKLQEFFTEKVLHQASDMEHIHDIAVKSTENVKGGNEEIREAMKSNASFRVWILFFLLVLSLTLLFLDWYS
ncbi:syntaxin-18-like [Oscarella lobularis]|uniref:syntaxin-18-like n=1 Tax=Oscarella lobularis TaxID=121494 RepID=UPI003313928D